MSKTMERFRSRFLERLVAYRKELDRQFPLLHASGDRTEILEELARMAHECAGVAALFDFEELGQRGSELDGVLRPIVDEGRGASLSTEEVENIITHTSQFKAYIDHALIALDRDQA